MSTAVFLTFEHILDMRDFLSSIVLQLVLDDLLEWSPVTSPSACLCTQASRDHKWRIVLHTIHYALNRVEDTAE